MTNLIERTNYSYGSVYWVELSRSFSLEMKVVALKQYN